MENRNPSEPLRKLKYVHCVKKIIIQVQLLLQVEEDKVGRLPLSAQQEMRGAAGHLKRCIAVFFNEMGSSLKLLHRHLNSSV